MITRSEWERRMQAAGDRRDWDECDALEAMKARGEVKEDCGVCSLGRLGRLVLAAVCAKEER